MTTQDVATRRCEIVGALFVALAAAGAANADPMVCRTEARG